MQVSLNELVAQFPSVGEVVTDIQRLRTRTARAERTPFSEPPSLVALHGSEPTLEAVGPDDINAWRRHMSDGASVRLRALEVGAAAELAAGRMLSAMATIRAHMEIAGLATSSCEALFDSGRTGDFESLSRTIMTSYFGTSMRIQQKGTPAIKDYLRQEEVRPFRPGELIKSMDRFRSDGESGTLSQLTYGLLCEYAHPTMRGTSAAFVKSSELPGGGWTIQYHDEGRLDEGEAQMALEILLDNMRIGHAAAALLATASVSEAGDRVLFAGPSPAEAHDIYVNLLQQPPGVA